jgi:phosphoribosyl-AMP cyclohydrolase
MSTEKPEGKRIAGADALLAAIKFNDQGLVPAAVQDRKTNEVLTICYFNSEALRKSLETGTVWLYRRSQSRIMQKGETSGHIQVIREVAVDCEGKSLLIIVDQHVAVCHKGYFTCYFRRLQNGALQAVGERVFDPKSVY